MIEDELIGTQIDEYMLEALLGEGGMARVYRGRDVILQRYAAIKVITPTFRQDKDYLMRFEREARAFARLEHPHIVRLYRFGETGGLLYMAMQYIEGMDLHSVLNSYRQSHEYLEFPEAVRLIGEIGQALDYIHDQGIIHRDVKSPNILLDKTGCSHLTDFGLALLVELGTRGEILGSPHYLAPEQAISSAKAVPQSDLYSLGVIAYEMFTNKLPFDAPDLLDIAMMHTLHEPPSPRSLRPELPAALEAALLKALAKKPADRYPSGAELAKAIEAALAAPAAVPPPAPTPTSKTIPERVALDLAKRPLPPLSAAAAPPLASPQPVPAPGEALLAASQEQPLPAEPAGEPAVEAKTASEPLPAKPAAPRPAAAMPAFFPLESPPPAVPVPKKPARRQVLFLSAAVVIVLCLVAGCLGLWALSRLNQEAPEALFPGVGTSTAATPSHTPASRPTNTPTSMPAGPAVPLPSPAYPAVPLPSTASTTLELAFCDDGHCLSLINRGQTALPLEGLVITGKGYAFNGSDWGIDSLAPGGCLVLTGNATKWRPEQDECRPAAATLTSETDFWKRDLTVNYAGNSYGVCSRDREDCDFVILVK